MPVLSQRTLDSLPDAVARPAYDRSQVTEGIVHFGVGGFHRAHQAMYVDALMNEGKALDFGIVGVGTMPQDTRMRDALNDQDGLYTLVVKHPDGRREPRVIGSILRFLHAADDPGAVLAVMRAASTRIVSLTITEGGYLFHPSTGEFDAEHPLIQPDLAEDATPTTPFGLIVEALRLRREDGTAPFTVMSCDNIPGNGDVAKKMIVAFARLKDPDLAHWIESSVRFPNSMVDRITPVTAPEDITALAEEFGVEDAWPVVCEPFTQWALEDSFEGGGAGRPAFEDVGVQLVPDVEPYELMKLRLLNASHQALCYIGMLLGYQFVHEAMQDHDIKTLVQKMMDEEVTPILSPVPGVDLTDYKKTLIERFANPAIRDQLSRIGIYGSSGIPKFVLPSIEDQLKRGGPIKLLSFTVASWFRYLAGVDDSGKEMPMLDPMAPTLRERAKAAKTDARQLLGMREIFSEALANSPAFANQVGEILRSFYDEGARATLAKAIR
jgi:mannitol 2-dehydrogenase